MKDKWNLNNNFAIQEHADPTVGLPFDDIDGDPEEIGWILAEWKRNNHMPLDETILAKTPDFRSNSQSPRVKPELGVEEDQFDKGQFIKNLEK